MSAWLYPPFPASCRVACTIAPFPQAPLKFRTAGFPHYGFKLACPSVKGALPWGARRHPRLTDPSFLLATRSASSGWPRGMSGPASPSFQNHANPRVLGSAAPLQIRHWFLSGNITTLQCSLHATARRLHALLYQSEPPRWLDATAWPLRGPGRWSASVHRASSAVAARRPSCPRATGCGRLQSRGLQSGRCRCGHCPGPCPASVPPA